MKCSQALNRIPETYWKLIQWSVVGLAFVLIGTTLYLNWGNLSSFDWHLNCLWFGVSLVLVSLVVPLLAIWWTLNIRLLHEQLGD